MNRLIIWGIPFLIMCAYGFLASQTDLRQAVPALVAVSGLVTILLTVGLYTGETRDVNWSPWAVLAVAAIVRLFFVFRGPELSSDLYRYLWDGLQVLAGHNPYGLAPGGMRPHDAYLTHLARHINHPNLVTIYPPAAQLIFALGALFGGGLLGLKAVLVLTDLATCFLLIKLCGRLRLASRRVILYAWHPLPVLEIAGSGHIDGACVCLILLALLLLSGKPHSIRSSNQDRGSMAIFNAPRLETLGAGLAFAGAVLVKLVPLMLLPGCLIPTAGRARRRFLVGFAAGTAILVVPFLPELRNGLRTLGVFARYFEFSGFLYYTLRAWHVSADNARLIVYGVFGLVTCAAYGILWMWHTSYARRGEATLRFQAWSLTSAAANGGDSALWMQVRVCYFLSASFLLLTPVLNPWYALLLAGFLPFAAEPAGLVLSWSVFLSYEVLIPATLLGKWTEDSFTSAVIWIAPCAAFLISMAARGLMKLEAVPTKAR